MPAKQKIGNSQGPLKVSKYPIWTWSLISGLTLIVGYIVLLLLGPKLFNLSQYEKKSFYKYSYQHGFLERTVGKGMDNQPKKSKLALYLEEKQFYPRLFNETQMRSVIDNKTVQLILDAQMESEYLFENEEAMRFVQKRNHWRKKSVTKGVEESANSLLCKNCAINIQCYNANFSLWHPAKCPRLKQYSPENIYLDEKCFNLSMMLIGDSRARMLYAAVLRRYYPDWKLVSRLNQQIPLGLFEIPNTVSGDHQEDFWVNKETEIFGNVSDLGSKRFSYIWTSNLGLVAPTLLRNIKLTLPNVVVLSTGAWLAMGSGPPNVNLLTSNMNKTISFFAEQSSVHNITIIVFLSELPMEITHGITVEKIRTLNAAAVKLVEEHFPNRVQVFNAYLPLQARYMELCKKYDFPMRLSRKWICMDKMHAGTIINDHYAQMLLNHVCQS